MGDDRQELGQDQAMSEDDAGADSSAGEEGGGAEGETTIREIRLADQKGGQEEMELDDGLDGAGSAAEQEEAKPTKRGRATSEEGEACATFDQSATSASVGGSDSEPRPVRALPRRTLRSSLAPAHPRVSLSLIAGAGAGGSVHSTPRQGVASGLEMPSFPSLPFALFSPPPPTQQQELASSTQMTPAVDAHSDAASKVRAEMHRRMLELKAQREKEQKESTGEVAVPAFGAASGEGTFKFTFTAPAPASAAAPSGAAAAKTGAKAPAGKAPAGGTEAGRGRFSEIHRRAFDSMPSIAQHWSVAPRKKMAQQQQQQPHRNASAASKSAASSAERAAANEPQMKKQRIVSAASGVSRSTSTASIAPKPKESKLSNLASKVLGAGASGRMQGLKNFVSGRSAAAATTTTTSGAKSEMKASASTSTSTIRKPLASSRSVSSNMHSGQQARAGMSRNVSGASTKSSASSVSIIRKGPAASADGSVRKPIPTSSTTSSIKTSASPTAPLRIVKKLPALPASAPGRPRIDRKVLLERRQALAANISAAASSAAAAAAAVTIAAQLEGAAAAPASSGVSATPMKRMKRTSLASGGPSAGAAAAPRSAKKKQARSSMPLVAARSRASIRPGVVINGTRIGAGGTGVSRMGRQSTVAFSSSSKAFGAAATARRSLAPSSLGGAAGKGQPPRATPSQTSLNGVSKPSVPSAATSGPALPGMNAAATARAAAIRAKMQGSTSTISSTSTKPAVSSRHYKPYDPAQRAAVRARGPASSSAHLTQQKARSSVSRARSSSSGSMMPPSKSSSNSLVAIAEVEA